MVLRRVSIVFTLVVFCSLECIVSNARIMTKPYSKRLQKTNEILSQSSEELNEASSVVLGQSLPEQAEHDWVQIIDSPGDYVAKEGTNVELFCEAIGSPPPTIQWMRDDRFFQEEDIIGNSVNDNMIPELPRNTEGASGRTYSRLLVPCVTLLDAASYKCTASANGRKVEALMPLSVVPRKESFDDTKCLQETILSSKLQRPYIVLHNSMMLQTIGMTVELVCRVQSPHLYTLYWTGPNGFIVNGSRFKVLKSGSLVITPLKWVDMGQYTCIAENSIGQDSAITFLYPMSND